MAQRAAGKTLRPPGVRMLSPCPPATLCPSSSQGSAEQLANPVLLLVRCLDEEFVARSDFDLAVHHLAPRGRMILMAGREARPPFPVGPFYVKGCALHGFVMFMATADEQRAASEDISRWISGGRLRANIDRVMPLSETAEAHRLQEENTVKRSGILAGKIVLKP